MIHYFVVFCVPVRSLSSCMVEFVQFDRLLQNGYFVAATPSYVKNCELW